MQYILESSIINGKYVRWVIIRQEYDFDFSTPKSKKALAIVDFITNLPSGTHDPPLSDQMIDEHLFHLSSPDKWYGDILTYLHTQTFAPQHKRNDQHHICHHATCYLLI